MSRRRGIALILSLVVLPTLQPLGVPTASGQVVQALRSLDELAARQRRGEIAEKAESLLVSLSHSVPALRESLPTVERRVRALTDAQDDERDFAARFEELDDALSRLPRATAPGAIGEAIAGIRSADPTPGLVVPEVVFVVGPELVASRGAHPVAALGIYSNLLGAAAGSALGAITSDKLKTYITDHLSVGTAVPLSDEGRLSGQLGLGLGSWTLNGRHVWGVLNFDQIGRDDSRVPRELLSSSPNTENWSTPSLSFTFTFWNLETVKGLIRRGRPVPFVNLGVGAPQYYPGNLFGALGALLSDKRKDYVRAAHPRWSLTISFPLLPFGTKT